MPVARRVRNSCPLATNAARNGQSDDPGVPFGWWMYPWTVLVTIYLVRIGHRYARHKLEPRQRRLRELLAALDAREWAGVSACRILHEMNPLLPVAMRG